MSADRRLIAIALGGVLGGVMAVLAYGVWLVYR